MDKKTNFQSSSDFINEAQNVVINAVDNVSEMISATTQLSDLEPHHTEVFYKTPEFWVGVAFLLVVVALAKPLSKIIKKALIKRRDNIVDKIKEAENLRDEAQELLAQYERKFLNVQKEAQEILDKSNAEIKNLTDQEIQKIEDELLIKKRDVDLLITATIEKAKNEISELTINKSVNIVKKYIKNNFNEKQHEKMINASIQNIISTLKQ